MKEHVKKTFDEQRADGYWRALAECMNIGGRKSACIRGHGRRRHKAESRRLLMDKHDTVGIDCVAMCVKRRCLPWRRPLFFLDYIATGKLVPAYDCGYCQGCIADGCVQSGCALIGGETAEMPGFYPDGEYDMAGFAVGIVEKDKIINGSSIAEGDVLIGLASSGVHSNGFSLVRRAVRRAD